MSTHILAEYQQPLIPTKLCPDCKDPNAEFGINRSRKSGPTYCKRCNADRRLVSYEKQIAPKFSRAERVKQSLAGAPLTFDGIAKATKLTEDVLGDVLALLILHKHEVESWSVEIESEDDFDFTRWYRLVR